MSHLPAENITDQTNTASRLETLLVRLSADPSDQQADKQAAAKGQVCLLQTLLYEIDETILPRQLTLYFGDNGVAELKICHRRLISLELTGVSRQENPPIHGSTAQIYAQQFRILESLYKNTGFRILRQPCETDVESESCSARLLAQTLATQPQDSRLKSVLGLVSVYALAWVLQDEDSNQSASSGPTELVQQLSAVGDTDKAAKKNRSKTLRIPNSTPSILVLSMTSETQVIVMWDRSETLIVAMPTQHLTDASLAWRSIFSP